MKIGVSLRSSYPVADGREGARFMVERAAAAAAAGLDSLFVGDHHATGDVAYYQNSAILGRLLAEWGDRPAGALYLLPAWNPVLVAEQVGTLATLARGPFVLQCAVGGGDQMAAMGAPVTGRGALFERNLSVIRRLLAGEEADGVRIAPVTPSPLEVWLGGHAASAIDRAARLGDGWIAAPWATDEQAAELAAGYLEACEVHGRPPGTVVLRRAVHVGADDADARRVAGPVLSGGYRGMDPSATVVGGPEEVAERLTHYAAMGYDHILIRHLAVGQSDVLSSFARLAWVRQLVEPVLPPWTRRYPATGEVDR
ncbi:MAG TPA: LLM class flavin-dependent oxidoreductase [Acidimicrobiia bacterium]|nr:LLM class flavin-dependent oxidoreductase [Acidimicrobiia bacterium]